MKPIAIFFVCLLLVGCHSKVVKSVSQYDGTTQLSLVHTNMAKGYASIMWNSKIKDYAILTIGSTKPIASGQSLKFKTNEAEYVFEGIDISSKQIWNKGIKSPGYYSPGYYTYEMRYRVSLPILYKVFGNKNTLFRYEHDTTYSEGCFCDIIDIDWIHYVEYLNQLKVVAAHQ